MCMMIVEHFLARHSMSSDNFEWVISDDIVLVNDQHYNNTTVQ